MDFLETVLSPIIWVMRMILEFYFSFIPSAGVSILLLSITLALLLLPLQKKARKLEQRIGAKMEAVNAEVQTQKGGLKGEELFLLTEKIYEENNYHPIQSVYMGASFFVMLPVLVSAIVLFTGSDILASKSFLFVSDLSLPDAVFGPINILPLLMSAITIIDARMRFKDDIKSQWRFFLIAFVLLVIVYNLPAGLVLYWTGSNAVSLAMSWYQSALS